MYEEHQDNSSRVQTLLKALAEVLSVIAMQSNLCSFEEKKNRIKNTQTGNYIRNLETILLLAKCYSLHSHGLQT